MLKSEKSEIIRNKIFGTAKDGDSKSKVAVLPIIKELCEDDKEAKKIWYEFIGSKDLEVFREAVYTLDWRDRIDKRAKSSILKNIAEMDLDYEILKKIFFILSKQLSHEEIIELIEDENIRLQEFAGKILVRRIGFERLSAEISREIIQEHIERKPNLHNYYVFLNEILGTQRNVKFKKLQARSSSFRSDVTNLIICRKWSESFIIGDEKIATLQSLNTLSRDILNLKLNMDVIENSVNILLERSKDPKYEFPIIVGLDMFLGLRPFWHRSSIIIDNLDIKFPSLFQRLLKTLLNFSNSKNHEVRERCASFFENPNLQNKETLETLVRLTIDNESKVYLRARKTLNLIARNDKNPEILEELLPKVNNLQKLIILNSLKKSINKELMEQVITEFRQEDNEKNRESIFSLLFEI